METDGEAQDAAATPGSAATAGAITAAMLRKTLGHYFTLLSMLTAAQPSLLDPQYVPALLEIPTKDAPYAPALVCWGAAAAGPGQELALAPAPSQRSFTAQASPDEVASALS